MLFSQLNQTTKALVLACREQTGDDHQVELCTALANVDDWQLFSEHLERHRINSIVGPKLLATPEGVVPKSVKRALSTRLKLQAMKSAELADELIRVVGLCDQQNISTLHYKGPAAAVDLYGDLYARPFGDLDFLIQREQVEPLLRLFLQEGYKTKLPESQRVRALHYRYRKEIELRRRGIVFEPHFAFSPASQAFDPGFEALWRRRETITLTGATRSGDLQSPNIEDLVLIYAVAGSILEWRRLPKIVDFARAAEKLTNTSDDPEAAWQRVNNAAINMGWQRALLVSALLAHKLISASLPKPLLQHAESDPMVQRLASKVIGLLNKPLVKPSFLPRHHRVFKLFHWQCRERLADRLRYLLTTTTIPGSDLMQRVPLPAGMNFAYRVITPLTDYVAHPLLRAGRLATRRLYIGKGN